MTYVETPLRLLVVSPLPYHPECGNGGGVLCYELLRRLGMECEVHFICLAEDPASQTAAVSALEAAARTVRLVPLIWPSGSRVVNYVRQLVTGTPRDARMYDQPLMHEAVAERCRALRPDIVLLQFPYMAQYIRACLGIPVVMDVQDACMVSRYREWRASSGGVLRRLMLLHTWLAWMRYEVLNYGVAQRLMALSDSDLGVLRSYVSKVTAFLSPVAWHLPTDILDVPDSSDVVLMGNFGHAPNVDALRWMVSEVWPLLRVRCPSARLLVVGKQLPADLVNDEVAGIERLGFIADLDELWTRCAVSVVPYRFGGGVKIKALEAMANGCPVVATTIGAEGLGAVDDVHLRVADGARDFADAIAGLVQSPSQRLRLAVAARALISERFSWESKVASLMREFRAIKGQRNPLPAASGLAA